MARPKREGLDYFPLDVNAGLDDEIEIVEAEYGLEGFAIFIKLLQKIYKNSYFIMWTEKEQLQFSKRVNVDINRVNAIIMSCLKWDLLCKTLYDKYKILTSKGIQKRFLLAIDRRTSYEFLKEYLLLSENELKNHKNIVLHTITLVNDNKTLDNVDNNPQRESKEKVKESKEKEKEDNVDINSLSIELMKYIEEVTCGKWYLAKEIDKVHVLLKMYSLNWIKDALNEAAKKGKYNLNYTEAILKNWTSEGRCEHHGNTGQNNETSKSQYDFNKPYSGPTYEGEIEY